MVRHRIHFRQLPPTGLFTENINEMACSHMGLQMSLRRYKTLTIYWVAIALATSFFLPAFSYTGNLAYHKDPGIVYGLEAFALGPIGLITVTVASLSWFSNVMLFIALRHTTSQMYRQACIASLAGMLLIANFFIVSGKYPMSIPFGGYYEPMKDPRPHIGFFVWLSAFLVLAISPITSKCIERDQNSKRGRLG